MSIFEGLQAVGNIHPLFVHFPVALLMMAGILFIAGNLVNKNELMTTAKWNLSLGALSAVATVVTGFMAANTMPHNEEIHQAMEIHENIMITMTILSLSLAGYLFFQKDKVKAQSKPAFICGLLIMMALLAIGADYGGKMVFKYGAGTELFLKVNPGAGDGHKHDQKEGHGDSGKTTGTVEESAGDHGHDEHEH